MIHAGEGISKIKYAAENGCFCGFKHALKSSCIRKVVEIKIFRTIVKLVAIYVSGTFEGN